MSRILGTDPVLVYSYCNAVTSITDLVCALFAPNATMFVSVLYSVKSLKTHLCEICLCSGVGTIAVLYCVALVTVKYFVNGENANNGPVRQK